MTSPQHPSLSAGMVAPLVWREPTDHPMDLDGSTLLVADGLGGKYHISDVTTLHKGGKGHLLWWALDEFTFGEFDTVGAAQAAAQADYASRVLPAVQPLLDRLAEVEGALARIVAEHDDYLQHNPHALTEPDPLTQAIEAARTLSHTMESKE